MKKKLYLVDVSNMFFRAFYAIPPLSTSKGLPTNALYGLLAMTIKLLRESKPDYLVYCFDRPEASFRAELFEDYKANRSEMPEDLVPQMPYIRDLIERLGIKTLDLKGYEADDLIGTLAKKSAQVGIEVSIVSGDKDFAQLINGNIYLLDTMKNVRYDREKAVEKWGVEPEQMIDYLAMIGDSSDNIAGIRGVGPKTAQKLLSEYKNLDNIYKHVDEIKGEGLKKKLKVGKKDAYLAQKLVTIVTDLDLKLGYDDLKLRPIDRDRLKAFLDELEFGAFMRKLFPEGQTGATTASAPATSTAPAITNHAIAPASVGQKRENLWRVQWTLDEFKRNLKNDQEVWVSSNERGICFAVGDKLAQVDASLHEIGDMLSNTNIKWSGFDLKSIWRKLEMKNTPAVKWDTMLAAYVLKAGDCEDFSAVYKDYTGKELPDLSGAEEHLECELRLQEVLQNKLEAARGLTVLNEFEVPLVPVLFDMERRGVLIDVDELKRQSVGLTKDIERLEKEIHRLAGESFNIASTKQLGTILFEKLKIPFGKKTKTGYSTDVDVLSGLAREFPICGHILQFRELAKLKSTYVDALPAIADKECRVHTHFHQALTQTGRLSSTDPNLQNIPIRTERGREIRKAFVAAPGKVLLSVDYSQIELRVLCELTKDPGLSAAFERGEDIHAATAASVFGVAAADVTADQRRIAKAVNFGIAYGQGVFGLADQLEISREEAKTIIENYFRQFPKVKEYTHEIVETAKKQGYVETLFGRRRYLPELNSSNGMLRKFGERAAINAPMQGTASDIMKMAMIKLFEKSLAPMLLQVHDEMLFECDKNNVAETSKTISGVMEDIVKFSIPLKVNAAWGSNWDEAH